MSMKMANDIKALTARIEALEKSREDDAKARDELENRLLAGIDEIIMARIAPVQTKVEDLHALRQAIAEDCQKLVNGMRSRKPLDPRNAEIPQSLRRMGVKDETSPPAA